VTRAIRSIAAVPVRVAVRSGVVGPGRTVQVARASHRAGAALPAQEAHFALAIGAGPARGTEGSGVGVPPRVPSISPARVVFTTTAESGGLAASPT
jgi:hypothetical protein